MSPGYLNEATASFPRRLPDPLSRLQSATAQLIALLAPLRLPGTDPSLATLSALERALDQRVMEAGGTALLLGESEAAKSRFLHALLDEPPHSRAGEPTGASRVARSACTWITYGREPAALVTTGRGRTTSLRPAQLPGYLANQSRGSIAQPVVLRSPSAALEAGLVLIDAPQLTPDTSGFLERTAEARAQANAILFLIEAGRAPTEATLRVLRALRPRDFLFVLEAPPPDAAKSGAAGSRRAAAIELEERLAAFTLSQYGGVRDPQVVTLPARTSRDSNEDSAAPAAAHRAMLERASALWQTTAAHDAAAAAHRLLEELNAMVDGSGIALRTRARLLAAMPELRELEQQIADAAAELRDAPVPLAGSPPPAPAPGPTLVPPQPSDPASLPDSAEPTAAAPLLTAEASEPAPESAAVSNASGSPDASTRPDATLSPRVEVADATARPRQEDQPRPTPPVAAAPSTTAAITPAAVSTPSAAPTADEVTAAASSSIFVRLADSAAALRFRSHDDPHPVPNALLRFRPMLLAAVALAILCAVLLSIALRHHASAPAPAPAASVVQPLSASVTPTKQVKPHRRHRSSRTHKAASPAPAQ